jgi:hypothetical protein
MELWQVVLEKVKRTAGNNLAGQDGTVKVGLQANHSGGPAGRENRYPVQPTSGAPETGIVESHGRSKVVKIAKAVRATMAAVVQRIRAVKAKVVVHLRPPHVL